MRPARVVVIGAGIGGLAAAAMLSKRGLDVTLVERASKSGGKMREVIAGGRSIDSGPTVLTMRWIFEEIFAEAGGALSANVTLEPAAMLARHAWTAGEYLDLHASIERSVDAIAVFAGKREADGYRRFCQAARRIYQTLEKPFLMSADPSLTPLIRAGARNPLDLWAIRPFSQLWQELGRYFKDARLRQLFARYATYCGSSPFLAPATLMLIAHVEQEGVWLVQGGMQRLAEALEQLCAANGARVRHSATVERIILEHGRVAAIMLAGGERLVADAVIYNGEVAAISAGELGTDAAKAVDRVATGWRSMSALTWSLTAKTSGFALARHTVFFSNDYAAEFTDVFDRERVPANPTVYVCAQDRTAEGERIGAGPERLFCLVNAPPYGERGPLSLDEVSRCTQSMFERLNGCGLEVASPLDGPVMTQPADFERMFPGSGGALYGRATHGWKASFERPGVRTRLPGLYLAGGSVHPGAGLPMVALSGRHAAQCLMADLASTGRFHPVAMPGGILMGSARTDKTRSP